MLSLFPSFPKQSNLTSPTFFEAEIFQTRIHSLTIFSKIFNVLRPQIPDTDLFPMFDLYSNHGHCSSDLHQRWSGLDSRLSTNDEEESLDHHRFSKVCWQAQASWTVLDSMIRRLVASDKIGTRLTIEKLLSNIIIIMSLVTANVVIKIKVAQNTTQKMAQVQLRNFDCK